jgi:signal transduction histidine kinase
MTDEKKTEQQAGDFYSLSAQPLKSASRYLKLPFGEVDEMQRLSGTEVFSGSQINYFLSSDQWQIMADELKSKSDEEDLFYRCGANSKELDMLGPEKFLPWLFQDPIPVIHNFNIILEHFDHTLRSEVEFINRSNCKMSFHSITGGAVASDYLEFVKGFLVSVISLWGINGDKFSVTSKKMGAVYYLNIHWSLAEFKHRRTIEELLVRPELFNELFTNLRQTHSQDFSRLSNLVEASEQVRKLKSEQSLEKIESRDVELVDNLKDTVQDLLTNLQDGEILVDDSGLLLSADANALHFLGFDSFASLVESSPTLLQLTNLEFEVRPLLEKALAERETQTKIFIHNFPSGGVKRLSLYFSPTALCFSDQGPNQIILRDNLLLTTMDTNVEGNRQLVEALFLNNPAGLIILNTAGKVVRINPRLIDLFSMDVSKIVGERDYTVFEDEFFLRSGIMEQLEKALAGELIQISGVKIHNEISSVSAFSNHLRETIIADITAYPLRDSLGNVFNIVVSFNDVTEDHLVEQQLAQVDKMQSIGTLTSGIAHDFNNILGAIVPNADLISRMAGDNEKIYKKAISIKTAAKRASSLTQQLLSFARLSEGDRQVLDINTCVLEAVELISNAIPKNISLDMETSYNLPMVKVDPLQMQQVLINLIINAGDAMPDGGLIMIKTEVQFLKKRSTFGGNIIPTGKYVRLSVTDEGEGIPPEVMQRVFDPFFTTKEKGRGTGLGLSVVHGIIKSHKGMINISVNGNKGTQFEVLLPSVE